VRELVAADLLKLRRRRGLWLSALCLPAALTTLIWMLAATNAVDLDGGATFVRDTAEIVMFIGSVLAVLVGARLGSEEHAAGTLRYQLLTGVPRHKLYLSKILVLLILVLGIALAGTVAVVLGGLLLSAPPGADPVGFDDVLDCFWNALVVSAVYGWIALGTGMLLRSTGPAIAVALILYFVGLDIVALLTLIDEWFRNVVLSSGIDKLTINAVDKQDQIALGAAIAVTIVWPAAFLAAGWARLRRLEA
jgi:ABC-type transport system involved in multi-copper enzyme maturation permease subunit